MGQDSYIEASATWANMILRYPERYGKLSGYFLNLLDEANLPPERKAFHLELLRTIDKPAPVWDNVQR